MEEQRFLVSQSHFKHETINVKAVTKQEKEKFKFCTIKKAELSACLVTSTVNLVLKYSDQNAAILVNI